MIGSESEIRRAIVIREHMKPIVRRTETVLKAAFPDDAGQIALLTRHIMENCQASWWIGNGKDILQPTTTEGFDKFGFRLSSCLVCATIMTVDHTALAALLDEPADQIKSARSNVEAWSSIVKKSKTQIWLLSQAMKVF